MTTSISPKHQRLIAKLTKHSLELQQHMQSDSLANMLKCLDTHEAALYAASKEFSSGMFQEYLCEQLIFAQLARFGLLTLVASRADFDSFTKHISVAQ